MEKDERGMGIKNLNAFNLALVGKWKWRFLLEKYRLWVKVVECKYGGDEFLRDKREMRISLW